MLGVNHFSFRHSSLSGQLALPPADLRILDAHTLCGRVWLWMADHALLTCDDTRWRIELSTGDGTVLVINAIWVMTGWEQISGKTSMTNLWMIS
jgi:hypothetical protein